MKNAFYGFCMFCALANAAADTVHWHRGDPTSGFVWLYAITLSVMIAFHCFDRLMTKEECK